MAARELLDQVVREGSLDGLLAALGGSPEAEEFEVIPGAMTDGSKRRLTSHDESVGPASLRHQAKSLDPHLPEGISTVKEWGQTLIQTRKYAHPHGLLHVASVREEPQGSDTAHPRFGGLFGCGHQGGHHFEDLLPWQHHHPSVQEVIAWIGPVVST